MDFQHCKNTLFLLQEENYRITYFICIPLWQTSLVSQNMEELRRSRLGDDFRGFFSCIHFKGTLCGTVSRRFFCRTCLFPFLVFPLFLFLPFLSLLFPLCLLKPYLVNWWANSHHPLFLAVIVIFLLAKKSFVFQNVTLLLAQRAMISDKLP